MLRLFYRGCVAAESIAQVTCNPADGCDAHPGQVVYAPVREVLLQESHDLPPVNQCLELGRCAQVLEKIATVRRCLQTHHGIEQRVLIALALAVSFVAIGFHSILFLLSVTM